MPTTNKFIGDSIEINFGSTPIGNAISKSISFSQNMVEASDSDSEGWEQYLAGFRGATIDFEAYVDYANEGTTKEGFFSIYSSLASDTYSDRTFSVTYGTGVTGDTIVTANCLVESLEQEASAGEAITLSGTLRVTGKPTTSVNA